MGHAFPAYCRQREIHTHFMIAIECPFDCVGGHVEAAPLCNHLLEPTSLIAISRIVQNRSIKWRRGSTARSSISRNSPTP